MDFIDRIKNLASRIERQRDAVGTEEATKTAFVMPFLQALGYDVFNPEEVIPEFTADIGEIKKGEKVDYAIMRDGEMVLLIECKPLGAKLELKHTGQLYRYFSVSDCRFGLLTDGVHYLFYSDLEKKNCMDDRPFFVFNILKFTDAQVEELKKFSRSSFDLDTIVGAASDLKYHRALIAELNREFDNPSDDLVKFLTARVHDGRFTAPVREQFVPIVTKAMREFLRNKLDARLQSALNVQDEEEQAAQEQAQEECNGIITTEEEVQGLMIVKAIVAKVIDPNRVVMRDAKSYCSILCDDNNRRAICRLRFGKTKMAVSIYPEDNEIHVDIDCVTDLYQHADAIRQAASRFADV